MVRSYIIGTSEIDDEKAAVSDLLKQLEELPLGRNSVGIMVCHYDYVTGGVVKAVLASLPFPVLGITSFYQATPAFKGLFELSLTVMTSDDVRFAVADSFGLEEMPPQDIVRLTYARAYSMHQEVPGAIISFFSPSSPVTGDAFLRLLDGCSGGVPVFGAVSVGDDEAASNVYVISSGGVSSSGFVLLLLIGEVEANYYFGNTGQTQILELVGTITRADGVCLQEVNGQPALSYLRKSGVLILDGEESSISTIPFLIRPQGDERLLGRTLGGFNVKEELFFFGEMPQQSILRIGAATTEDILDVSRDVALQAVQQQGNLGLVLMFSCVGRYITLGLETTSEMDYATSVIPPGTPYLACYVGGEICPVSKERELVNRYHNSSFVLCTLS